MTWWLMRGKECGFFFFGFGLYRQFEFSSSSSFFSPVLYLFFFVYRAEDMDIDSVIPTPLINAAEAEDWNLVFENSSLDLEAFFSQALATLEREADAKVDEAEAAVDAVAAAGAVLETVKAQSTREETTAEGSGSPGTSQPAESSRTAEGQSSNPEPVPHCSRHSPEIAPPPIEPDNAVTSTTSCDTGNEIVNTVSREYSEEQKREVAAFLRKLCLRQAIITCLIFFFIIFLTRSAQICDKPISFLQRGGEYTRNNTVRGAGRGGRRRKSRR